jgi:hypothetical protein
MQHIKPTSDKESIEQGRIMAKQIYETDGRIMKALDIEFNISRDVNRLRDKRGNRITLENQIRMQVIGDRDHASCLYSKEGG